MIEADQPCLAVDRINHVAEPILLVAHPDKHALIDIDRRVTVEYAPETPNYDPEAAELCFKRIAIDTPQVTVNAASVPSMKQRTLR